MFLYKSSPRHFIGVYIVKYHIHYPGRMRCYCQLTPIEYMCGGKLAYLRNFLAPQTDTSLYVKT